MDRQREKHLHTFVADSFGVGKCDLELGASRVADRFFVRAVKFLIYNVHLLRSNASI